MLSTTQSVSEFTYPGAEKIPNPGVYKGFNYRFQSGWTITLCGGGNEHQTLCYVGHKGRIHLMQQFIDCRDRRDDDDKRFLNIAEIRQLFDVVSKLDSRGIPPVRLDQESLNLS